MTEKMLNLFSSNFTSPLDNLDFKRVYSCVHVRKDGLRDDNFDSVASGDFYQSDEEAKLCDEHPGTLVLL